ncbi:MAG TPA: hypothetical protein DCM57_07760 [Treponema sp.]|nr:hypothetical protein [Treponema sp.]
MVKYEKDLSWKREIVNEETALKNWTREIQVTSECRYSAGRKPYKKNYQSKRPGTVSPPAGISREQEVFFPSCKRQTCIKKNKEIFETLPGRFAFSLETRFTAEHA